MKTSIKLSLVFLFFLGLSVVYTSPLVRYLDKGFSYTSHPAPGHEVVPFTQSDSVQLYYHFWMAWDYLHGGPGPFFQDPYEFKTGEEGSGVFTTRRLLISLLYLIFTPLGTVVAFNLLILLCVGLNGFAAFLLARHYTGKILPSLVAGLIFGFSPFGLAQILGGHTNGFLLFLIPLIILCFEKGIQSKKNIYFLLSSIGFVCFALIEYHLIYYMALFVPPFFLFRMWMERVEKKFFFRASLSLIIAFGFGLLVMLYIKIFEIEGSIRSVGRSFQEIALYTPTWRHYFYPYFEHLEQVVYLGVVAFGGALFSFLFLGLRRPLFWIYAVTLAFFGLLCLGLSIDKYFPIYRFFHEALPYFSLSRLPGRMAFFVSLSSGMLIALGCARLKKGGVIAFCLLFVLAVEYFPRRPVGIILLPPKSKVYEYLKENAGGTNILCLPIWPGDSSWSSIYLYYVTQSRIPLLNGYYPVVPKDYIENVFYPLYSMNVGELSKFQIKKLKEFKVKYIVLHEEAFPQKVSNFPSHMTWDRLASNPYLKVVFRDHRQTLFELLEAPRQGDLRDKVKTPVGIHLTKRHLRAKEDLTIDKKIQILPEGEYVAHFRFQGDGAKGVPFRLLGSDPLKRENGKYIDLEILATGIAQKGDLFVPFTLSRGMLVSFQIEKPQQGKLGLEFILICMGSTEDSSPLFLEAEDLFSQGETIAEPKASGGEVVHGMPMKIHPTEILFGPYRLYPSGDYTLTFWMKAGVLKSQRKDSSPLAQLDWRFATLEVTSDYGRKMISQKELRWEESFQEGYQPFSLSFSLEKEEVLEFRVKYWRNSEIFIDKIEIEQQPF